MMLCRLFLCLLVFCTVGQINAQDFSNKGKEFWIAYPSHIDGTSSVMGLYITSSVNANVTVQVGPSSSSFTVTANQLKRFFIGSGAGMDASNLAVYLNMSDGIKTGAAIKVTSDNPIVVYSHIIRSARSAATLVLPTTVLGVNYIAPSISSTTTSGANSGGTTGGVGEIAVVATQDNTIIEITPTFSGGSGISAAIGKYRITLVKAGDVYQVQSNSLGDISGTKISSVLSGPSGCKPIAVFSATSWSAFDCTGSSGGDNLFQQLFPTRSWGKQFVTAPFINRPNDIFRIYTQDATTTIDIRENGTTRTMTASEFNALGSFYFYKTNNPLVITASAPVSVVQFITSQTCKTGCTTNSTNPLCAADPEMVILNPVEQTLSDITFFSAHRNFVPPGQTQISQHYVNLVINSAFKNSVKIDNAAPAGTFIDIPNSNYSYLQEDLTNSSALNPIHRITADISFSAIVYGYGNVESYGYNGGTNVIDLNPPITIQNQFSATNVSFSATCSNTPFKINLSLPYQPTKIVIDFAGNPNLIGDNNFVANAPTLVSTEIINGKTFYKYTMPPTYKFSAAGTYPVKITTTSSVTQTDGCSNNNEQEITDNVVVNAPPTADFTISTNNCINSDVSFTDLSDGLGRAIVRWIWKFSDGATSSNQNPKIKFSSASNFTAELTSITDFGCVATIPKTFELSNKPIANFIFSTPNCINTDIIFRDISTLEAGPNNNTIKSWVWNFDNGSPPENLTTNANQIKQYITEGVKDIGLVVQSNTGCLSDPFKPIFSIKPSPSVVFVTPKICLDDPFAPFNDESSVSSAAGLPLTRKWTFPLGIPSSSILKDPKVKYPAPGTYEATLEVTSSSGCLSKLTKPFFVNGSTPKANFNVIGSTPFCNPLPIKIQNKSTVDIGAISKVEIYWDHLGSPTIVETDNDPIADKMYEHKYPDLQLPNAQPYTIRFIAYTGGGSCVNFIEQKIQVFPQPKAKYIQSATQICVGQTVNFTDLSNGVSSPAIVWNWNFGTGFNSLQNSIQKQFSDSGVSNISLFFANSDGCISDIVKSTVTVFPNPKLFLKARQSLFIGESIPLMPDSLFGNNLSYLWSPASYLSDNTVLSPICSAIDDITYTLKLTSDGGCMVSKDIFVLVLKPPKPPNAFSPNGDGINDRWKIQYLERYPGATVDVYNRYGQAVFSSVGYDVDWDGTVNGKALPIGTYYYIINPKSGRKIITGSITIIR